MPSRSDRTLIVLALSLAAATFALDLRLPLGISVGVAYVVVVLLSFWIQPPAAPLIAAAGGSALAILGGVFSPPSDHLWIGIINRALTVLLIWAACILLLRHRRLSAALSDEARRAQEYLDLAGAIMLALDAHGSVTLINRRGCAALGYKEEEILGRNWFDLVLPPAVRDEVREMHRRAVAGEVELPEYFENAVQTRTGEERIIAWHNAVLREAGGTITGTLSSGEDITARRQAETALRNSVKELADIKYALDQSAIVASTDTRGIIRYANQKFCDISKYSRGELLGQDHRIVNSGYHPKSFMRDLWVTIANGQIWRGEICNRAKDGSVYWVDTTIVPFLDARGKPYQYMAIRNDITERKRTEALLREQAALARLGEMAAVVAHEVKNPLAGIRGALQVIGGRMPADSRDRAVMTDVVRRLDSLNEIVQDLLQFARPRALRPAPVQVLGLLRTTAVLLRKDPVFGDVEVALTGDEATIQADAELLQTVFLNLLLNAAQAMGGSGRIQVGVESTDGACRVAIADEGPGIPAEVQAKMFEPFFTTKHRGTGLGLATARRFIDLHGGRIQIASPSGGGTRVTITLPAQGA